MTKIRADFISQINTLVKNDMIRATWDKIMKKRMTALKFDDILANSGNSIPNAYALRKTSHALVKSLHDIFKKIWTKTPNDDPTVAK